MVCRCDFGHPSLPRVANSLTYPLWLTNLWKPSLQYCINSMLEVPMPQLHRELCEVLHQGWTILQFTKGVRFLKSLKGLPWKGLIVCIHYIFRQIYSPMSHIMFAQVKAQNVNIIGHVPCVFYDNIASLLACPNRISKRWKWCSK